MNLNPSEKTCLRTLLFLIAVLHDECAAQTAVNRDVDRLKLYSKGTIGNRMAREFAEYQRIFDNC